ncbi:MAG: hypothetical protein R2991_05890 [Thermoanaerobaculia bacterium]
MADAWVERRDDVETQAGGGARRCARHSRSGELRGELLGAERAELAASAVERLGRAYDPVWGGFGGAGFDLVAGGVFLAEIAAERPRAEEMLATTLDRWRAAVSSISSAAGSTATRPIASGVSPTSRRCSTTTACCSRSTLSGRWAATAGARRRRGHVGWLAAEPAIRERAPFGALSTPTRGREGAFYAWTRDELLDALGEEDFGFLAPLLGFDGPPFFGDGGLCCTCRASGPTEGAPPYALEERLVGEMERAVASARPGARDRPPTTTSLADWNGMAIGGLAVAGGLPGRGAWLDLAEDAARFLTGALRGRGELCHSWRDGRSGPPAFLSDYVWAIHGLLALADARPDGGWLPVAVDLAEEQIRRLAAPAGGYFAAGEDADLLARSREVFDGAVPAPNAVAGWNWVDLAARTGETRWLERARSLLEAFGGAASGHPGAVDGLVVAALRFRRLATGAETRPRGEAIGLLEHEARSAVVLSLDLVERSENGVRDLRLGVRPVEGWRIAGPAGSGPPEVSGEGLDLGPVRWPADAEEGVRDGVELRLRASGEAGGVVRVRFAACDRSRCLPPTCVELPVPG